MFVFCRMSPGPTATWRSSSARSPPAPTPSSPQTYPSIFYRCQEPPSLTLTLPHPWHEVQREPVTLCVCFLTGTFRDDGGRQRLRQLSVHRKHNQPPGSRVSRQTSRRTVYTHGHTRHFPRTVLDVLGEARRRELTDEMHLWENEMTMTLM